MWMIAFFLFRMFDVYKPWPASFYDNRSRNGYDTMMDDVVAGIYALPGVAAIALFIVKV
jgi:phosphatidylglycerophosphatase A